MPSFNSLAGRKRGLLLPTMLVISLLLSGCDLFGSSAPATPLASSSTSASNTPVAAANSSGTLTTSTVTAGSSGTVATNNTPASDSQPTGTSDLALAAATASPPPALPTATQPTAGRSLNLSVTDAFSGKPIVGATISGGAANASTDANGGYSFASLDPGASLKVNAPDYHEATVDTASLAQVTASLIPSTLRGRVTDGTTGKPLPNVMVRVALPEGQPAPEQPAQPITATPGAALYHKVQAAPLAQALTGTGATTATNASAALLYLRVSGTDGDGLSMVVAAQKGAERVGIIPEGTVLQVVGPDATNPDNNLTYANVQTLDGTKKGYCSRQFLAADPGPNQPTFTPVPPTATPAPPPKADLLQQPITTSTLITFTNENGEYTLRDVPLNPMLHFKYSGYELTRVQVNNEATKDVALKQFHVKAVYFTAEFAATSDLINKQLAMVDSKEINAVVLNVQTNQTADYHGINIAYGGSQIPLLKAAGEDVYIKDMRAFVQKLKKEHNLYVIARISTFVQSDLVQSRPDLAIKNASTGKPIRGGLGQLWLDMTNPATRAHVISIINEVKTLGFDEIQMDYVRFPSDTEGGGLVYSVGAIGDHPDKAQWLQKFLSEAYENLRYTDVFFSADVFGYSLWPDQAEGPVNRTIGQVWEYLIKSLDYVSPMIYPSHFSPGELGFNRPNDHPYEIIKQAGVYAAARFARSGDNPAKYRPWLQYFTMNGTLEYTGDVIRLQKKAAAETNTWGWIMWDASNQYVYPDAFDPKPKP